MFEWTLQQQQWFKDGACINYKKQSHYARDCRQNQSIRAIKGTITPRPSNPKQFKELKGTKGCIIKHFAFCYNNKCLVHEEAKYSVSYWPQKPSLKQFKNTKKKDKQNKFYYRKDMHSNNEPKSP